MLRTGFQSSRKMFKQTFPSKSIFGWYTYNNDILLAFFYKHIRKINASEIEESQTLVLLLTFGASCGYILETWNVKTNLPFLFFSIKQEQMSEVEQNSETEKQKMKILYSYL